MMGILLYIDPGTGSMLFTILIGLIGAGVYAFRMLILKFRFFLSGGKKVVDDGEHIPFVIFSDNKRYWNVFEPVCREFDRRGVDVVYMTASPDDPALNSGYEHVKGEFIGEGNRAFARLNFIKADILLSTTPGLDVYQWKRSRDVKWYVHIFHAASDVTLYRSFGIDYYDALLLSGQFQIDQIRSLEKLRELPEKELVVAGIPYMDEMKARLDNAEPVEKSGTTVLLAPTWGPEGILSKFGEKLIDELIKTGYQLIIRPHPQSFSSEKELIERLMEKYPESDTLQWNRDTDNFDVLRKSDIMISDFSGVVFDFTLVYDKPVIYTAAKIDTSVYDAWWLGTPTWTETVLPRLGKELNGDNLLNVGEIINECLADDIYSEGRESVRRECWAFPGESVSKVTDYLIDTMNKLKENSVTEDKEMTS